MHDPSNQNPTSEDALALLRSGLSGASAPTSSDDVVQRIRAMLGSRSIHSVVVEALREGLASGEIIFDPNGHWRSGDSFADAGPDGMRRFISGISLRWALSEEEAAALGGALAMGKEIPGRIKLGRGLLLADCPECDMTPAFDTNARDVRATSTCPYPRGVFPMQFDLNVPSGKLIFANDLREWFPVAGHFNVDTNSGLRKTTMRYAEDGMAHCFMTHPRGITGFFAVNRVAGDILHIEPLVLRIKQADTNSLPRPMLVPQDEPISVERLGKVPMRLWWWSAVDYDDLRARFESSEREFKKFVRERCLVVNVEPGLYRVNHYEAQPLPGGGKDAEFDGLPFHSVLIRSGPAEERNGPRGFRLNVEAGQVVWQSLREYPDLYFPKNKSPDDHKTGDVVADLEHLLAKMNPREELSHADEPAFREAWQKLTESERLQTIFRVVNHMLLGSSCRWDKSGWCADSPDVNVLEESIPIPVFPPGLPWDVVTPGLSTIARAAGMDVIWEGLKSRNAPEDPRGFVEIEPAYMNRSFRVLAFNMLQSVIRTGIPQERDGENDFLRESRIKTPEVARIIFDRLVKLYPKDVPEYCADLIISPD